MKDNVKQFKRIILFTVSLICVLLLSPSNVFATENAVKIDGNVYEYSDNKDFLISDDDKSNKSTKDNSIGKIEINGSFFEDPSHDNGYICDSKDASISYIINSNKLSTNKDQWHIINTNSKKINNINIGRKADSGAIIIQTSTDGVRWVEDLMLTDAFKDQSVFSQPLYTLKDIQLENGTYIKITVAYTLERKTGTKKIFFINKDVTESKQVIEEYKFYVSGGEDNKVTIDSSPKKEFSSVVNAGKDTGYSKNNAIDRTDPHFGWSIGYFTINGYTRETEFEDTPIYLKNYGDKVTLWFTLLQDINCLNNNTNLTVAEDINGYDNEFKIDKTNFKHGTILIRYTDENGNAKKPIIYTDFLAANATTTANTKVQLFEEGDYEVSLDYEVEEKSGIGSIIKTYNDYRISFSFKIRNGNNMVFPFDIETGNELSNNSITESGFRLDLAQSKYLTIDVTKSQIKEGSNKLLIQDIRFNRPAKDGDEFTDEGMYTITVKNLYTDSEPTTKTIYIGDNKYLKALSKYSLTLDELNNQIRNGAKVNKDGSLSNSSLKVTGKL